MPLCRSTMRNVPTEEVYRVDLQYLFRILIPGLEHPTLLLFTQTWLCALAEFSLWIIQGSEPLRIIGAEIPFSSGCIDMRHGHWLYSLRPKSQVGNENQRRQPG